MSRATPATTPWRSSWGVAGPGPPSNVSTPPGVRKQTAVDGTGSAASDTAGNGTSAGARAAAVGCDPAEEQVELDQGAVGRVLDQHGVQAGPPGPYEVALDVVEEHG